eukprot:gene6219-7949_t
MSKRQLLVVQWWEGQTDRARSPNTDFATSVAQHAPPEIKEAWQECEQLRRANQKNVGVKKNISKRLRQNERDAEKFREELNGKITGQDRREFMELQYQVGRLELENMELEQHRIVHDAVLKGKDLTIQKLMLQLAVKDKLLQRQNNVLKEHGLEANVGYKQIAMMEQSLITGDSSVGDQTTIGMVPPSPLRDINDMRILSSGRQHAFLEQPSGSGSARGIASDMSSPTKHKGKQPGKPSTNAEPSDHISSSSGGS